MPQGVAQDGISEDIVGMERAAMGDYPHQSPPTSVGYSVSIVNKPAIAELYAQDKPFRTNPLCSFRINLEQAYPSRLTLPSWERLKILGS